LPARVEPVKRHHVDLGIGGQHLADHRAVSAHEVEHAGRQPGFVDRLGEHERIERRDLGRLQDDRAAGRERRRDSA
jgi:ParB family chromosome partitioning protein